MRNIKFRGLDAGYLKEGKKVMRHGSLVTCENGDLVIETSRAKYGCSGLGCQIVESTLGQYTGLKDKNGVEIYEGDILQVNEFKYPVLFHNGYGRWQTPDGNKYRVLGHRFNRFEVIGNIHEHGELLS